MKWGILISPGAHAPAQVKKAEACGFDSAFFIDSPMIFGDLYVSMAAAAVQTRTIMLSTGVTNPLTRSAPVTAANLASLNALAPGRIALGISVGFTANFAMGKRNATLAELEAYVQALRGMLRGDTVEADVSGERVFVQFLNTQGPWVNVTDRIPFYVAGAGPKSLELAGQIGDAVMLGGIANVDIIEACKACVQKGAARAGRKMEEIELAITPSIYVTEKEPTLDHLREVLGPKSLAPAALYSRIAESSGTVPKSVTRDLVKVRDAAYAPELDPNEDPRRRHLKAYRGYLTQLKEWQYPLVTETVLDATSIAGTVEQCLAKIKLLRAHGIGHIILSPLPQHMDATIETYGARILPRAPK